MDCRDLTMDCRDRAKDCMGLLVLPRRRAGTTRIASDVCVQWVLLMVPTVPTQK